MRFVLFLGTGPGATQHSPEAASSEGGDVLACLALGGHLLDERPTCTLKTGKRNARGVSQTADS